MNILKNIKSAEYFIGQLTKTAKRSKTEQQKKFYVDMINSFVDLVNSATALAQSKLKSDVIDSLLLARIYDQLQFREFRSMNYSSNVFVVEKSNDGLNLLGYIETDSIVEGRHTLSLSNGINELSFNVKSCQGSSDTVGVLNHSNANELLNFLYGRKNKEIDIYGIVRNIDNDIKYDSALNKEKVISFLNSKEAEYLAENNSKNGIDTKAFDVLVDDLLTQFKENMQWKKLI